MEPSKGAKQLRFFFAPFGRESVRTGLSPGNSQVLKVAADQNTPLFSHARNAWPNQQAEK